MGEPVRSAAGAEAVSGDAVDRLIRETRPSRSCERTVAFLGGAGAGRTVLAALLRHTLTTMWVPGSRGRWDAVSPSGHDEINEAIRFMKSGLFPPAAAKSGYPALGIDMHRMTGAPGVVSLALRDAHGESRLETLSGPHAGGIDGLLAALLDGGGSHIAHAAAYAIVISCEDADGRAAADAGRRAAAAVRTIRAIKGRMGLLDHAGRFAAPVALVFTKADALSPGLAQAPVRRLADAYPGLVEALTVCQSGPLACFKVHAGTGGGTGQIAPAALLRRARLACFKLISWLADACDLDGGRTAPPAGHPAYSR